MSPRTKTRRAATPPPAPPQPPKSRAERLIEAVQDYRRAAWRCGERALAQEARVADEFARNGAHRAANYVEDAFQARAAFGVTQEQLAYIERFAFSTEQYRAYVASSLPNHPTPMEDPLKDTRKDVRAAIIAAAFAPPEEREAREYLAALDLWISDSQRTVLRYARNNTPQRVCVRDVMEGYNRTALADALDSTEVVWTVERLRNLLAEEV